jgi:hypothetical protein
MLMIKNELVSASVMSLIVAILVWWNSPKNEQEGRSLGIFIKAFVIAFVISFALLYFLSDSGTDEAIENMIKGPPDF